MACYTKAAMERAMKVREVVLRALAKKITWWQAGDYRHQRPAHATLAGALRGVCFRGLFDRGGGTPSPKPGHLHLLRTVFCCGIRGYCFRRAKPRILPPNCLINRIPKIDFGNGFAHPRPGEGRGYFVRNQTSSTLQLKPGDHSTLDHPGSGMRAKSPEVSRCCNRVFQAPDSGRLLCARDQQNVHADDLQTQ